MRGLFNIFEFARACFSTHIYVRFSIALDQGGGLPKWSITTYFQLPHRSD